MSSSDISHKPCGNLFCPVPSISCFSCSSFIFVSGSIQKRIILQYLFIVVDAGMQRNKVYLSNKDDN